MMMMQVGSNANQMSQAVPIARFVMPTMNTSTQAQTQFDNLLAATTPELELAILNFSRGNNQASLAQQSQVQQEQNAAVDGLVRALSDMQEKNQASLSATSTAATVAEPSFSDITNSPRSAMSDAGSEFSPDSPASTTASTTGGSTAEKSSSLAGVSLSSLDPKAQEELKRLRKKERNRVAAMKCRKRKIEREQDLDGKVKTLKAENGSLTSEIVRLRSQVYTLKQTVMEHINSGCNLFTA
ncbi:transcription factor JunD-like [Sycon ciliatum]|uniref:transcription factor JunD-like n=1 Tax=Sycon ciliatum TaxID=27933 RepID=UPI0031F681ED